MASLGRIPTSRAFTSSPVASTFAMASTLNGRYGQFASPPVPPGWDDDLVLQAYMMIKEESPDENDYRTLYKAVKNYICIYHEDYPLIYSEETFMEVLQLFAIKASSESVLINRGGGEEDEEDTTNLRCSNTSFIINANPDAFVPATSSKQKLHQKPRESKKVFVNAKIKQIKE